MFCLKNKTKNPKALRYAIKLDVIKHQQDLRGVLRVTSSEVCRNPLRGVALEELVPHPQAQQ